MSGFYAKGVYVSGNYAYVAYGNAGLRIVDVSNPFLPMDVGFAITEEVDDARGIRVSGNYAYVADAPFGLRIIDITTPTNPEEAALCETGDVPRGVCASGEYIYVAAEDGLYILQNDLITGIKDNTQIPSGCELGQNYPNPFNPATSFSFTLPTAGRVTISIFDIRGREMDTLADAVMPAGEHKVTWNGRDQLGMDVPSGIYLYQTQFNGQILTGKMTLVQ